MTPVAKRSVGADVKATMRETISDLGGLGAFVGAGQSVLIKPNFNTADTPPGSTALDFLQAAVELVFEAGAGRVVVGESSMIGPGNRAEGTRRYLHRAGVDSLEWTDRAPEIHLFDEHPWVRRDIPQGRYLTSVSIPAILDEVDRVILLPCCKTHRIADFTGALKIAVGMMKSSERTWLHMGRVAEKVAELNTVYQPDLVLMDARKCFITGGPARGDVREPGLVLASTGRLAIDREAVAIIQSYPGNALAGRDPEDLPQIKRARELGLT